MKFTKNYGLKKPEQTDFYDVDHGNDNMDILDEKLNEASHYQGNLSSTYDYDDGFVFSSDGDGRVWEIPRALKVVYDAVCNLASNGVGKNKNRVDKIEQVISRASNTWIIPDYLKDAIHYVCGAGTPEENGYSADDYNDENGYGEPYLDVVSGIVYEAKRVKDLPLTYSWVAKEQLESVQNSLSTRVLGYSVIYNAQLTSTPQSFASISGRKFSDYDFVVAIMSNNGEEIRASTMCPISIFQAGWPLYIDHWSAGGVTFNQHLVKYVDDTHIQANITTSETVCKYLNIYGFKLT